MRRTTTGLALGSALVLTACAGGPAVGGTSPVPDTARTTTTDATTAALVELPPTSGVLDYQLGGAYDEVDAGSGPVTPDVVVRDATAAPLSGAYNVCYVNGFQTQPDDADLWLAHEDLLLHDADGVLVVDPDWPDEFVLDPSTAAQRDGILDVLGPVVTGCAGDGFDAVEIDNLDTWTRFAEIDEAGAHALATAYVDLAHDAGLAIAQKNAAEITQVAHDDLGFDFAVTEECAVWDECAAYTDVYGDHVLQVEYPGPLAGEGLTFADACALPDRAPLTVLRDLYLVTPDTDVSGIDPVEETGEPYSYVFETC
ncbi:endo alpha-1,4 polygalactosaminidase [Cellulosimicrobium sp. CpK407]|uniref:endo alpha-1,4 polygalactosaminidase n=1 Tax=Cellulosimicrobium sp. CpK407 TaxID=3229847 RepID=UPI003F36DCE5